MKVVISRFASSLFSRLTSPGTAIDEEAVFNGIRDVMLRALLEADVQREPGFEGVWTSIVRAQDTDALWYLRSSVFALLAKGHGEKAALGKLDGITEMFRGVVPESQFPVKKKIKR
jgi:hypothetical protein